ncbi:MAG: MazG-like family protein [Sporolactobacillus sp.]|jgi:NTP pyrophosphatase (non-canonical NTP hydrolase)|nr:MazG-like family protein [Sporolactobacillus sp.]
MGLREHQKWLVEFYKQRDWYQYSPFIRLAYLSEEVGELSQAVRAIEIGRDHPGEPEQTAQKKHEHLCEELADILDQVLILSSKYAIPLDGLVAHSELKLQKRFPSS